MAEIEIMHCSGNRSYRSYRSYRSSVRVVKHFFRSHELWDELACPGIVSGPSLSLYRLSRSRCTAPHDFWHPVFAPSRQVFLRALILFFKPAISLFAAITSGNRGHWYVGCTGQSVRCCVKRRYRCCRCYPYHRCYQHDQIIDNIVLSI